MMTKGIANIVHGNPMQPHSCLVLTTSCVPILYNAMCMLCNNLKQRSLTIKIAPQVMQMIHLIPSDQPRSRDSMMPMHAIPLVLRLLC